MAIFKYTLPSGSKYQMTAPDGTTQAEADKIFYEQVASGTFVGYKQGSTLTNPKSALVNFGLSRLERGTAGVDDKTLLSVVSGLPTVGPLPALTNTPITTPVTTADYLQVTSDTAQGRFSLGQSAVGPLTPQDTQALMGQLAAVVDQPADTMTQEKGVGIYGFSCQQLERAGYVAPGYCDRYCPVDPSTQQNSDTMIATLSAPGVMTGKSGVTSIDDILSDPATQNQIQQELMQQSYESLVAAGTIVPPPSSNTTPDASTGQVYSSDSGTLLSTTGLALLASGIGFAAGGGLSNIGNTFSNLFSSNSDLSNALGTFSVGTITDSLQQLGSNAVATFTSGLSSLESGAIGFAENAKASLQSGYDQITGLASGDTSITSLLSSNLNGDIGALITNSSKYGPAATQLWASGQSAFTSLSTLGDKLPSLDSLNLSSLNSLSLPSLDSLSLPSLDSLNLPSLASLTDSLPSLSSFGLSPDLLSNLDILGKSSQFSVGFADFSLSGLSGGVQAAAGFTNTVDRATVDAAVTRVIGSEKISSPSFEFPSLASLGITADINQAKSLLAGANNIGGQVVKIKGLLG